MTTCSKNGIVNGSQWSSIVGITNEQEFDQDAGQRLEEIFDKKLDFDTSEKLVIDKAKNKNFDTSTEPFNAYTSALSSGQAPNRATLESSSEITGIESDKITWETLGGQTLQMSNKPMPTASSKVSLETPTSVTLETSRGPSLETPTSVTLEIPRGPSLETPTSITLEIPRGPSLETPTSITLEIPRGPSLETPTSVTVETSRGPTLETPTSVTLETPSGPTCEQSMEENYVGIKLETSSGKHSVQGPTRKLGTVNEQHFMTSVCKQLTTTKEDLIKTFDADATFKPIAVLGIGEQINSSYDIVDLDELDEDEIRSEDQYCESEEDEEYNYPMGLRLGPIGQDREDEDKEGWNYEKEDGRKPLNYEDEDAEKVREKMKRMEAEQEELSGSLQALTSHFARLQLRLQQVTAAPEEQREELLNDLLKFSNLGIPDFRAAYSQEPEKESSQSEERRSRTDQGRILEDQRRIEADAISTLKVKLEELESYAYQAGEATLPSSLVLQRQSVVLEQLKERLNIDVSDIARLSEDELKAEVDSKLCQFVNPLRMKSQLVSQLQTQIQDLEMFIHFIQEEPATVEEPICGCDTHCSPGEGRSKGERRRKGEGGRTRMMGSERVRKIEEQKQTLNLLKKAVSVLQMTSTVTSLGCGSQKFKSNTLKGESGHYGDLRAKLELAVEHLLDVCCDADSCTKEEPGGGDDIPLDTELLARSPQLTGLVRRELVPALRDLLHHGLGQKSRRGSLLPFSGCMSGRSSTNTGIVHVWDVITRYYELKGGAEFNSAPARRLSRSFGLDLAPTVSNNKQVLLQTIGQILSSHSQYKRTPDQHFKAFVSAGLNKRKLVPWLRLILRNQTILETMYQPSSYVVTTGFDDGFHLLERLSLYVFNLPVNLAVKQFQDMDEAF